MIQPQDWQEAIQPWLDAGYFMEEMPDHPDKEILSMLKTGVVYKAELEFHIVLLPHSPGLKDGVKPIFDEVVSLAKERNWYKLCYDFLDNPPLLPERNTVRSATPRDNEPDRPRILTDGGAQDRNRTLFDEVGNPVESINVASTREDSQQVKWFKEIKPMHADAMIGLSVLMYVAHEVGDTVYFFTDDATNFFNQCLLARSEYFKCETIMYDYRQDMLVMVAEYCMSFGISPASNIAQRLAILITDIVKKTFDTEEEQHMQLCRDPFLNWWWQQRKELSRQTGFNEARLYVLEQYTDDPLGGVLGADRMKRFIMCWTRCTRRMRLKMAIPKKRQLGCYVKWIGAKYHSLGLVVVPKDKRMKAMHDLLQLIHGHLNCEGLQKLNGLLEFIAVVVMFKRNKMQGMYEPFQAGRESSRGGATLVRRSKLMIQSSWAWVTSLSTGCAAPFLAALSYRQVMQCDYVPLVPTGLVLHATSSDASKEGADIPGIGGFFAGLWWSLPLDWRLWQLDIPALELMGFAINLLVFADVFEQLVKHEQNALVAFIDAKASPQLLLKQGTTSWTMARVLNEVQRLHIYKKLFPKLWVGHTAGEGNLASDDASRGKFKELALFCSQVGMKARRVKLPPSVEKFVSDVWSSVSDPEH